MRTHRPWQPHLSSSALFNPFIPSTSHTTLDRYGLIEEEEPDEPEDDLSADQASDPPPLMKRD